MEDNNKDDIERRTLVNPFDLEDEALSDIDDSQEIGDSNGEQEGKEDNSKEKNTLEDGIKRRKISRSQEEEEEEIVDVKKISEEQEEEDDDSSSEGQSQYFLLAQGWKEEGFLPEDLEVEEDISHEDLNYILKEAKKEELKESAREEVLSELQEEGYTPEMLETARQLYGEVKNEDIQEMNTLKTLSEVDLTGEENAEDRKEVLKYFYTDKGFSEEKAQKYADRAFYDETDEEELRDAQEHFRRSYEKKKADNEQKAQERIDKRKKKKKEEIDTMKGLLKKGVINNVKYPKEVMDEVESKIFKESEIIEKDGRKYRVTPYQKKIWEMEQDPELKMQHIINVALGLNLESFKDSSVNSGAAKIIKELGSKSSKKASSKKDVKKLLKDKNKKVGQVVEQDGIKRRKLN